MGRIDPDLEGFILQLRDGINLEMALVLVSKVMFPQFPQLLVESLRTANIAFVRRQPKKRIFVKSNSRAGMWMLTVNIIINSLLKLLV